MSDNLFDKIKELQRRKKLERELEQSQFPKPLSTTDLPTVSSAYQCMPRPVAIVPTEWRIVAPMSPARWQIWFILSELDDVFIMPFKPPTVAGGILLNPSMTDRLFNFRDDPVNVTGEWFARCSLVGGVTLWVLESVPSH